MGRTTAIEVPKFGWNYRDLKLGEWYRVEYRIQKGCRAPITKSQNKITKRHIWVWRSWTVLLESEKGSLHLRLYRLSVNKMPAPMARHSDEWKTAITSPGTDECGGDLNGSADLQVFANTLKKII